MPGAENKTDQAKDFASTDFFLSPPLIAFVVLVECFVCQKKSHIMGVLADTLNIGDNL
jgi:hypothetical protein